MSAPRKSKDTRTPRRLSEGRIYFDRECPHLDRGCCQACYNPTRFIRRFRSRDIISDPKRLHEIQVPRRRR